MMTTEGCKPWFQDGGVVEFTDARQDAIRYAEHRARSTGVQRVVFSFASRPGYCVRIAVGKELEQADEDGLIEIHRTTGKSL